MRQITNRVYNTLQDYGFLQDLFLAHRLATSVKIYSTIWRTRLLLTSRVWDSVQDCRVWEDARGQMQGFAMLWRRRREDAYLVLERFVQPDLATDALTGAMLAWGVQRAQAIANERAAAITLYAAKLNLATLPDTHLEAQGFRPVVPNPEQYAVYFSRSLDTAVPPPQLPEGYAIRPLQPTEIQAFQSIYDFAAVNSEHWHETLTSDEYEHLVVVNPAGLLVAYCEYSICRAEWEKSDIKIGWINYVGTIPEEQRKGLGKAVLSASLNRLQNWGTEMVQLVTINTNSPAIKLYYATGFIPVNVPEAARYEKYIKPSATVSPTSTIS